MREYGGDTRFMPWSSNLG